MPSPADRTPSAAQGRDGRKDHQRRTGNDPQGPTGRPGGSYTASAAQGRELCVLRWDRRQ